MWVAEHQVPDPQWLRRVGSDIPAARDASPVLCFDRGGWSPDLFAEIIKAGFGLLTYENQVGKDIPDLLGDAFTVMTWTGDDGQPSATI